MKRSTVFTILVIAIIGVTIMNFMTIGESDEDYIDRIETERKEKNGRMLASSSPLLEEEKQIFKGLNYYPVNLDFKVRARLIDIKKKQPVFIPTTTGEQEKYIPYAYAEFEIAGAPQKLLLYKDWDDENPNRISLMFADATSAIQTYGGGRYMELIQNNTNSIIIDFNTSYNPYCHFNTEYSCPIPPRENLMEVEIKAGEMIYKSY
ncbi:MAG: hypothetical protein ACJAS3_000702 [Roseivirga sp.]|jgi:uncharacterized protein (DUF1684 family)